MCGIAGIVAADRLAVSLNDVAQRMAAAILHRGPDAGDVWCDSNAGVGLAHRRLAIVDLSPAGHQPMHSNCGRYVLVFNGEIYNHLELRKQLESSGADITWLGHSDTETLLIAIAVWGIDKALRASLGMFALALWDKYEKTLYLARDRMGEKPLYYGEINGHFVFASELKAIKAVPGVSLDVNRDVLHLMLRHSYVPDPYCIYKGLKKLQPGSWLTVKPGGNSNPFICLSTVYWSALDVSQHGQQYPKKFSHDQDAIDELDARLRSAIGLQMVADVPLGAFLSGGIDSSTVVALMQAQSSRPVKTFTIGFDEEGYNEAHHAKAVASHLGTEHTELYVTPTEALAVIPRLSTIYDEPFSDVSQIPTYLVSHLAKNQVTVSLSGDGGDELFGGYNRYFLSARLWSRLGKVPLPLRRIVASLLMTASPAQWDVLINHLSWLLPNALRANLNGDRLQKAASVISKSTGKDLYLGLVSHWNPSEIVYGGEEPSTSLTDKWPEAPTLIEQLMLLDSISYLPGDILTKVDRAAMSVSLETRVPMLDHQVVEFAASLPLHYKIRGGEGKWLLKQVLFKYVPRNLIERPKMGFGVPIDKWLRGPLRDWAENLLNESHLRQEGYLNPQPIRKKWAEHLSGRRNWQYHLWDILMFQAWKDEWL